MRAGACAVIAAAALAGCASLGPGEREAPAAPTLGLTQDDRFGTAPPGAPVVSAADLQWWHAFDDPALARWVEWTLAGNTDIALAAERVEQARTLLQSARARRGPAITAGSTTELQLRREAGDPRVRRSANLALDFEVDLWGGLGAAERSAAAGVLRGRDLLQAARLAAASLAARAYVEWRLAQEDHRLLGATLALQREALRIVSVRVEAGISPLLDRDRAQAEVAALEAEQSAAAQRIGRAVLALQVLAGDRPQLAMETAETAPADGGGSTAARGLPALRVGPPVVRPLDLLRLRPDLRAAEQALAAAAADIAVAHAALLPRLRLPGALVFGGSGAALDLVSATLSAALELTLFDGGAGAAVVDETRSRAREAALLYRQALLQALQQVEAALLAQQEARRRIAARQRASAAAQSALEQAQTLYRVGLTNFLDVADAQRSALANQRELLQARADAAAADVLAFEAMGLMEPVPANFAAGAPTRSP